MQHLRRQCNRKDLPFYLNTIIASNAKGGCFNGASFGYYHDAITNKAGALPCSSKQILKLGDKFSSSRCFSKEDVVLYAQLCRDSNPIHTQELAAKESGFPGCVVNGMLHAAIFPAIIGSQFPGAIYVSQTLNFREPVFVDEDLFAEIVIKEIINLKKFYKLVSLSLSLSLSLTIAIASGGRSLPGQGLFAF
ncbi:hypothetical protein O6H91_15G058600 [Diphasiastrum complanatum]|uniref:Uncharacterized protein n=1 Tax=Diphasiastrum complanatum TaxID=34168 RepID=A0ACC2BJH9_DIPCM|nr:hypothetical protein O6H91_15G058600 [Diphasiastrum complanatum]